MRTTENQDVTAGESPGSKRQPAGTAARLSCVLVLLSAILQVACTASDQAPDAVDGGVPSDGSAGSRVGASPSATPPADGSTGGSGGAIEAGSGSKDGSPEDADAQSDAQVGPIDHQFTQWYSGNGLIILPECSGGACASGTCYRLSEELSVCDQAQPNPYAGDCSDPTPIPGVVGYECDCDAGACTGGRVCAGKELTCSCAPHLTSRCVEPACSAPSDCPAGTVCVPASMIEDTRCIAAKCERDADCTAGAEGRCAAVYQPPLQAGETRFVGMFCVYVNAGQLACSNPLFSLGDAYYYYCP